MIARLGCWRAPAPCLYSGVGSAFKLAQLNDMLPPNVSLPMH